MADLDEIGKKYLKLNKAQTARYMEVHEAEEELKAAMAEAGVTQLQVGNKVIRLQYHGPAMYIENAPPPKEASHGR